MPKCIHAVARRLKYPKGLPDAWRLEFERSQAQRDFVQACQEAGEIDLAIARIDALSTQEIRELAWWVREQGRMRVARKAAVTPSLRDMSYETLKRFRKWKD